MREGKGEEGSSWELEKAGEGGANDGWRGERLLDEGSERATTTLSPFLSWFLEVFTLCLHVTASSLVIFA